MVRALPLVDSVWMSAGAAAHLYRLLARYNWCLIDPERYRARWQLFWPTLRWCERAMLRLCLAAHGGKRVGQRLTTASPQGYRDVLLAHRPVRIEANVEDEFWTVLASFYAALTTAEEVAQMWAKHCEASFDLLASDRPYTQWFADGHGFVPWAVFENARRYFGGMGWSAPCAQHAAADLSAALHKHLYLKEQELCAS